jgi:hypothetical protein
MTISIDAAPSQQINGKVDYKQMEEDLLNASGKVSLAKRFRTLFLLKSLNTSTSIDIIAKGTGFDGAWMNLTR